MSRIKGKNTKPEIALRKALWALGLRYRLKSNLPGRPDMVFRGKKLAVFVDGCFWHGCPEHYVPPKTNARFWKKKISENIARDRKVDKKLKDLGWTVFRVWEHEIMDDVSYCAEIISEYLAKSDNA